MQQETEDTDYQKADRELPSVCGMIIEEYNEDAAFIAALRASERAWIKFRDYTRRNCMFFGKILSK